MNNTNSINLTGAALTAIYPSNIGIQTGNIAYKGLEMARCDTELDWDDIEKLEQNTFLHITNFVKNQYSEFHLNHFLQKITTECYWVQLPMQSVHEIKNRDTDFKKFLCLAFKSHDEKSQFDQWLSEYSSRFASMTELYTSYFPKPPAHIFEVHLMDIPQNRYLEEVAEWLVRKNILNVCVFSHRLIGFFNKQDYVYFQMGFK